PSEVTSIEFDGQTRTLTSSVECTSQLDGSLLIFVPDSAMRTVRVLLTQHGQLVVQKLGLRYDTMSGFVADPREGPATTVDDTFTFSGRMQPNPGESAFHTFKVQTTCPTYETMAPAAPGRGGSIR